MATYTITFDEVKHCCKKNGKCPVCEARRARSKTFAQTLNPYNKNKDGIPKTRSEIHAELVQQAENWIPDFTCVQHNEPN